jgi:glucose dehydrogenase
MASPIGGALGDRKGACSGIPWSRWTSRPAQHFQTIHHDLWDADPPRLLFETVRNGRRIPRSLTTRTGYLYISIETNQPIFGVEGVRFQKRFLAVDNQDLQSEAAPLPHQCNRST